MLIHLVYCKPSLLWRRAAESSTGHSIFQAVAYTGIGRDSAGSPAAGVVFVWEGDKMVKHVAKA
jgi:hypothetical protein